MCLTIGLVMQRQLDDVLTKQLGDKYLERPDVSVGMKASTRRSVTIDGAVKSAGSFPVSLTAPKAWKGSPGLHNALKADFAAIVGQPRLLPLFKPAGKFVGENAISLAPSDSAPLEGLGTGRNATSGWIAPLPMRLPVRYSM